LQLAGDWKFQIIPNTGGVMLTLILVWLIAIEIMSYNAIQIGKVWIEAQHAGAMRWLWVRVSAWVTATGFVWCVVVVVCMAGASVGQLELSEVMKFAEQGYWLLVLGAIVHTYYYITRSEWAVHFRNSMMLLDPSFSQPFINAYTRYHSINTFKAAYKETFNDFFGTNDWWWRVAMVLLTIATLGVSPVLMGIIIRYSASEPLPANDRIN
jgi:hypothetical protein